MDATSARSVWNTFALSVTYSYMMLYTPVLAVVNSCICGSMKTLLPNVQSQGICAQARIDSEFDMTSALTPVSPQKNMDCVFVSPFTVAYRVQICYREFKHAIMTNISYLEHDSALVL